MRFFTSANLKKLDVDLTNKPVVVYEINAGRYNEYDIKTFEKEA